MERCEKCGRIPFYCNCKKEEIIDENCKYDYNEVEKKLQEKGLIGQANFIQSEKNDSGVIETYWVNYYLIKTKIPTTMESDQKHYKTKLGAMNGLLNVL